MTTTKTITTKRKNMAIITIGVLVAISLLGASPSLAYLNQDHTMNKHQTKMSQESVLKSGPAAKATEHNQAYLNQSAIQDTNENIVPNSSIINHNPHYNYGDSGQGWPFSDTPSN